MTLAGQTVRMTVDVSKLAVCPAHHSASVMECVLLEFVREAISHRFVMMNSGQNSVAQAGHGWVMQISTCTAKPPPGPVPGGAGDARYLSYVVRRDLQMPHSGKWAKTR